MNGNGDPVLTETQLLKLRLQQRTLDYQSMAHALWLVLRQVGPRTINPRDHMAMESKSWSVTTTENHDGTMTLEAVIHEQV